MGIEIPEQYGGGGGTFFEAILAVEELSRVDPSAGVIVDVQNTLGEQRAAALGNRGAEAQYLPRHGDRVGGRLCAERSRLGLGCVCAADARRAQGRRLHPERPQAVDHQRQGSRTLHRVRDRRSLGRIQGHHCLPRREGLPRIHRRQEGRQARHPRLQHLRTDPRRLPGAEGKRAGRSRQGIQDRHRDAERRPHRHRRADAGPGRRAPGSMR